VRAGVQPAGLVVKRGCSGVHCASRWSAIETSHRVDALLLLGHKEDVCLERIHFRNVEHPLRLLHAMERFRTRDTDTVQMHYFHKSCEIGSVTSIASHAGRVGNHLGN
jgi:hypothetical protein